MYRTAAAHTHEGDENAHKRKERAVPYKRAQQTTTPVSCTVYCATGTPGAGPWLTLLATSGQPPCRPHRTKRTHGTRSSKQTPTANSTWQFWENHIATGLHLGTAAAWSTARRRAVRFGHARSRRRGSLGRVTGDRNRARVHKRPMLGVACRHTRRAPRQAGRQASRNQGWAPRLGGAETARRGHS